MAERPEYKSTWTGQQVDDAVGKIIGNGVTPLTTGDIVQTTGTSPTKVMSQAAVTNALQNLPTQDQIDQSISQHNASEQAHPYIQGLIQQKPNALNDRSDSQKDTYSANYINNSFAPITFVSNLYASKISDTTADLVDIAPALSADNVLVSTATTNTDYNWSSPAFTFTRDLEVSTTLTAQNSFALNLTFQTSRNATISWGAKIKVSQDNGQSWVYISDNQAYGAIFYETGIGNTAIFNVFTNTIQGTVTYPIGTLLAIEIYKKQTSATALTTTVYCGVEVDNAGIYTYAQFNFSNVNIGTNQIEDGSVTKQKLEKSIQETLDYVPNIESKLILKYDIETLSYNTAKNREILNNYINGTNKPILLLQDDTNLQKYYVLKEIKDNIFYFINDFNKNGTNREISLSYINGQIIKGVIDTNYLNTSFAEFTLTSSSWSNNSQSIDISSIAGDRINVIVSNSNTGTDEEVLANSKAIAKANIYKITYDETTKILTLVCENTPTTDIKIQVGVQI